VRISSGFEEALMRKPAFFYLFPLMGILFSLLFISNARAFDIEAAVGAWNQDPSGDLRIGGFPGPGTNLSVEDNLHYDTENNLIARLRLDLPGFFPNVYLMATKVDYKETGNSSVPFQFGNHFFAAGDFNSRFRYNHYDIGLFYSIPLLKTATLNKLNMDLGLNGRAVNLVAEVSQGGRSDEEELTRFVPMLFAAAQLRPVKCLSLEAEARGLSIGKEHLFDLIGRLKLKPFPFVFIAGGYRYESVDIDDDDVKADLTIKGPFAEAGVEF
jgi:outer membrane protein